MKLFVCSLLLLAVFDGFLYDRLGSLGASLFGSELVALMKNGTRVVRGRDWEWDDQDGGPGSEGTILGQISPWGFVTVRWDNGIYGKYRMGAADKYDLELAPNRAGSPPPTTTQETESDSELAFKKNGTRVIWTGKGYPCWDMGVKPGTFGTVDPFGDENCVSVNWDDGHKNWYCRHGYEACVRLASTVASTVATTTPITVSETNYGTGDTHWGEYTSLPDRSPLSDSGLAALKTNGTRVIRNENCSCWDSVPLGSLGTVVSIDDEWDCVHVSWDIGIEYYYCVGTYDSCLKVAPTDSSPTVSTPWSVTETVYSSEDQWNIPSSTPTSLSGPELAALMVKGTRVVRGKDWMSDDTDGGPGNVGTIIYELDEHGCVGVKWDNGNIYWYRMGNYGHYDLKLAPTNMTTTTKPSSVNETVSYSDDDVNTTKYPSTSPRPKLAPFMIRGAKVVRATDWSSPSWAVVGTVIYVPDKYDCVGVKWDIGVHWYCNGTYEDQLRLAPTYSTTTAKPSIANETVRCMDNNGEDVYITESPWMVRGFDLLNLILNGTRVIRQDKDSRADDQDWSFGTILFNREEYSWNFYYPTSNYSCYYLESSSMYSEPTSRSVTNSLETSTPLSVTETVRDSDEGAELSGPELAKLMKVGTRVVRGKDWDFWGYFEQDGGEGGEGTVIRGLSRFNMLGVRWDSTGRAFTYRMGFEDKYDLQLAPKTSTTTWQPTVTTERVKSNKDIRRHKPRKYNKD